LSPLIGDVTIVVTAPCRRPRHHPPEKTSPVATLRVVHGRREPVSLVLLVVSLLIGGPPAGLRTFGPQPAVVQQAPPVSLDLAAMTLTPPDLPEPGFALAGAEQVALTDQAVDLARDRGEWTRAAATSLVTKLAAAGWRAHYESRLALPQERAPGQIAATVSSAITEYGSPAGAAAAFVLLGEQVPAAAGRPVRGLIALGEESRITRTFVPGADAGSVAVQLELTARAGNLIAAVAIADLTGKRDWGVAAVEGLGAGLLARVASVQGGGAPVLAPRLLRIDRAGAPAPVYDVYDRRNGETFPLFGVDPEDAADREHLYGAASDVYSYERSLSVGTAGEIAPYYAAKLYRFNDSAAAAAWLEGAPDLLFAEPGSFLDLGRVDDAPVLGDASATISYAFPASDTVTTHGYRVYVRVGNEVARIQLDGEPEVTLDVVEALARAQVACLGASACEGPPPIALDQLIAATPAVG